MSKQTPGKLKKFQTIIYRKGKMRFANKREGKKMYETEPKKEIQIKLDDDIAQGMYSNLTFISSNETEFVMDFIYVQPQQPKAKVRSRIILGPNHAKKFLLTLKNSVKKYEDKFGTIKISNVEEKKIGF